MAHSVSPTIAARLAQMFSCSPMRIGRMRRRGSTKRVAAAVGQGAQVVAALHAYLAQNGEAARRA